MLPGASILSEDNVREKLGCGAILVNGTEELPLSFGNGEPLRLAAPRRRRGRSRSLVNGEQQLPQQQQQQPTTGPDVDDEEQQPEDEAKSATLPRRRRPGASSWLLPANPLPPHRVTPDGTAIYYWCELPGQKPGSQELDDGAYNPLWTMRGFTQTFHFWKETKRAQSVPLNAFLTYITLPWWSIAKDILDHREGPILTF